MNNINRKFTRRASLGLCLAGFVLSTHACAIDVYLDFTGADPLLEDSWYAGGWAPGGDFAWNASDFLTVQHTVREKISAIFSPFGPGITFSDFGAVPGGAHTKIAYGAVGGPASLLGIAPGGIDWRNKDKSDHVSVYSGKFDGTFTAGSSVPEKEAALEALSTALANVGAHELGHSLGLQHFDAYGFPEVKSPGYSGVTGQQNGTIMSSGPSGATKMSLGEDIKFFSPLSINKLAYADGLVPMVGLTLMEGPGSRSTIEDAQEVYTTPLALSGTPAVNIVGEVGEGRELDFYKFEATLGALLTINSFSEYGNVGTATDTTIALYDATGSVLISNGDISFAGDSFMTGAGVYGTDSLILNYTAGYTGTYYASISGITSGDYNLLITGAVPEPATMLLLGAGITALAARRKRKTS